MIDTIFVDLGDTFRVIRKDEAYSFAAKKRICDLLGVDADPEAYYRDVIETRYNKYREWFYPSYSFILYLLAHRLNSMPRWDLTR